MMSCYPPDNILKWLEIICGRSCDCGMPELATLEAYCSSFWIHNIVQRLAATYITHCKILLLA